MALLLAPLIAALSLANLSSVPPAAPSVVLDVPYLPQTEALCGGAAAAMVLRYWGERHADAQRFAPLVDRRAGGITTGALTAALDRAGWTATAARGTIRSLMDHLENAEPVILLLEDRPGRYHYVVAVGADAGGFLVHDPTWGPSRRLEASRLVEMWQPADFWMLVVAGSRGADRVFQHSDPNVERRDLSPAVSLRPATRCDTLVDQAVENIAAQGLDATDSLLQEIQTLCPESAAPRRELAGLRFAQRRWRDSAALARDALAYDTTDTYSWDLLGSSRFLSGDLSGALSAWNTLKKPTLDSVRIEGLQRTRYAFLANFLGLTPNALLTRERYRLAEQRLRAWPAASMTRMSFQPAPDGFATVDVAIVERTYRPNWLSSGARALVDREIGLNLPGWSGTGDGWTTAARWWHGRPAAGVSFTAPRTRAPRGVWRVDGVWSRQAYLTEPAGAPATESWKHAAVSVGDWLTSDLRYEATAGADSWQGSRGNTRAVALGGRLERHFADSRFSLSASMTAWKSLGGGESFASSSLAGGYESSPTRAPFVFRARAQIENASAHAPFALWPGAGDGRTRTQLLRAHPLLDGGVISGPVFGRQVGSVNLEGERWFVPDPRLRLGIALFLDAGFARRRLPAATGGATQADLGTGLRFDLPGHDGTLRVDYAHGLRDGQNAVTFSWQSSSRRRLLP
jgi:hypothetical protein